MIWLGVFSIVWVKVLTVFFSCFFIYFFMFMENCWFEFCGHSMRAIPGLVSIPEVKSFCVLICVLWFFLWEFHFAASSYILLINLLLFYYHKK